MQINSVYFDNYNSAKTLQPQFGRVIKSRFFEVMPDGTKSQVQDMDLMKRFCKRLIYHLSDPWKEKKNRLQKIPDFLRSVDSDYATLPIVRRIFNFNRPKDHCFYLITGNDTISLSRTAFIENGVDKKSKIIQQHWKQVRDSKKRLYDKDRKELALNIYLQKRFDPKSKKEQMYLSGMELMREEKLQFPYRLPGEAIK